VALLLPPCRATPSTVRSERQLWVPTDCREMPELRQIRFVSVRPKGDGGDFSIERPFYSDHRSSADFEAKINESSRSRARTDVADRVATERPLPNESVASS